MTRTITLTALILSLFTSCKVDLRDEFRTTVEGSWEISSITFGESDSTVVFTSVRPRVEFFACEKNAGMCPAYIFDLEGDRAAYDYSGTFNSKEENDGGMKFYPLLYTDLGPVNDSLQLWDNFSFSLRNDTLILSEGEINRVEGFAPFEISEDATLVLVREQ